MKRFSLFICLLPIFSIGAQEVWTDKSRALPDDLRKLPEALYIMHDPNPNYPERTIAADETNAKYVWRHSTSVFSPDKDLQVIKAGSFIWYSAEGWKTNIVYSRRDFAKRFNCPNGQILKGVTYTFEKNYRYGDQLYGGDALWYVIAKDSSGTIYKGMGLIETESELNSNN